MFRDAELDRLEEAKEAAFQEMITAWNVLGNAVGHFEKALEFKRRASAELSEARERYRETVERNQPCIAKLQVACDRISRKIKKSDKRAIAAHLRGAGARAQDDILKSRDLHKERQDYVEEFKVLMGENASARKLMEAAELASLEAEENLKASRERLNEAQSHHETAKDKFASAEQTLKKYRESIPARRKAWQGGESRVDLANA